MALVSSVSRCSSELPTVVPFHTKPRMEGDNRLLYRTFHTPQLLSFHTPQLLSTSSAILWPNLFEHPALASPLPGSLPRLASAILGYALTSSPNGESLACSDLLPLCIKHLHLRLREVKSLVQGHQLVSGRNRVHSQASLRLQSLCSNH